MDGKIYIIDAFALGAASFLIYWLFSKSKGLIKWFQRNFAHESGELTHWMVSKYLGFILMGGFAGIFVLTQHPLGRGHADMLGIGIGEMGVRDVLITLGLAVVAWTISYMNRSGKQLFANYPEVGIKIWNSRQVYYYLASWFVYLIGYEMLFRGLLLISIAPIIGNEPALVISVAMYTFAHLDKAPQEVIGALFFGAVLGYYCLDVGSIYPALIVHVIFSLRSNYFSIKNNPEIEWKR